MGIHIGTCLLLGLGLVLGGFAEEGFDWAAAIERLGNDDFEERNQASIELWQEGMNAIPHLEKARSSHKDPQVRLGADAVHKHLSLGYLPGLSAETLALVKAYHQGQIQILPELVMAEDVGPEVANLLIDQTVERRRDVYGLLEFTCDRIRKQAWALMKDDQLEEGTALFERSLNFVQPHLKNHTARDEANLLNGYAWDCALARLRLDEALKTINEALRRQPHDTTFLDTKAEILFVRGDRAGARKLIERAIDLKPLRDPEYYQKQRKRFLFSGFDSRPDY